MQTPAIRRAFVIGVIAIHLRSWAARRPAGSALRLRGYTSPAVVADAAKTFRHLVAEIAVQDLPAAVSPARVGLHLFQLFLVPVGTLAICDRQLLQLTAPRFALARGET